ncbi:MAG: hypothetical protein RIQ70_1792, partial [Bacteroidota bacterium]
MKGFDKQTIYDLEFDEIRKWLMNLAVGPTAKNRLEVLSPTNNFNEIELDLLRVNEFKKIRTEGESFPPLDFEELLAEIKLLPIRNAVLQQEGFVRIYRASDLVNYILVFFDKRSQDYPTLYKLLHEVYFTRDLIESIEKVFDRRGNIRDDASAELALIRQKIVKTRNQINKNFERELRKYLKEGFLGETKEAFV